MPVIESSPITILPIRLWKGVKFSQSFYYYDGHEIESVTPGSGVTTIVTKDAHGLSNGNHVRILITDPYNSNLNGVPVATVIDGVTFTIPVVGVASTQDSGSCGLPTDISSLTFYGPMVNGAKVTVLTPTYTKVSSGTYGELVISMASADTALIVTPNITGDVFYKGSDNEPYPSIRLQAAVLVSTTTP